MNILIAPNAFKGGLDAAAAARAIKAGLEASSLDADCICFPVADGGDGTAVLLAGYLEAVAVPIVVADPFGRKISSCFYGNRNHRLAIIEMADASGLRLMKASELDPLNASSAGTGELIKAALDWGATKIIIGMGGSATVDAGAGLLHALGVRFSDEWGNDLEPTPESLLKLASINHSGLDPRLQYCEITVLCDVTNPLLGVNGAAAVFGPQKGAEASAIISLEKMLANFAGLALQATGRNMADIVHGGVAGGAAAGLYAFANARLVNGIDHFLDITDFDTALATADWLITGEGRLDEQSLAGKAPFGVAKRAKEKGISVIGLAGQIAVAGMPALQPYFDVLLPIGNGVVGDMATALKNTGNDLCRTAAQIGNLLALKN